MSELTAKNDALQAAINTATGNVTHDIDTLKAGFTHDIDALKAEIVTLQAAVANGAATPEELARLDTLIAQVAAIDPVPTPVA